MWLHMSYKMSMPFREADSLINHMYALLSQCSLGNMWTTQFKKCAKSLTINRTVIANIRTLSVLQALSQMSCMFNKFENRKTYEIWTTVIHFSHVRKSKQEARVFCPSPGASKRWRWRGPPAAGMGARALATDLGKKFLRFPSLLPPPRGWLLLRVACSRSWDHSQGCVRGRTCPDFLLGVQFCPVLVCATLPASPARRSGDAADSLPCAQGPPSWKGRSSSLAVGTAVAAAAPCLWQTCGEAAFARGSGPSTWPWPPVYFTPFAGRGRELPHPSGGKKYFSLGCRRENDFIETKHYRGCFDVLPLKYLPGNGYLAYACGITSWSS